MKFDSWTSTELYRLEQVLAKTHGSYSLTQVYGELLIVMRSRGMITVNEKTQGTA